MSGQTNNFSSETPAQLPGRVAVLFPLPPTCPLVRAPQGLTQGSCAAGSGVTFHSRSDRVTPSQVQEQGSRSADESLHYSFLRALGQAPTHGAWDGDSVKLLIGDGLSGRGYWGKQKVGEENQAEVWSLPETWRNLCPSQSMATDHPPWPGVPTQARWLHSSNEGSEYSVFWHTPPTSALTWN